MGGLWLAPSSSGNDAVILSGVQLQRFSISTTPSYVPVFMLSSKCCFFLLLQNSALVDAAARPHGSICAERNPAKLPSPAPSPITADMTHDSPPSPRASHFFVFQ